MQPFGSSLRCERERRRITLEDVSATTKIRISYLEAIEQDHLDELPGGIIGRGFVRAYARAVGIDEEETVAGYVANRAESETPLTLPPPKPAIGRPRNLAARLPSWAFVTGFLATGIGFVILGILRNQYLAYVDSSSTQTVSAGSSAAPSQAQEAKQSSPTERSGARERVPPQSVSAGLIQPRAASTIISSASAAETDALTLEIIVRQDAWLSIVADGRHIVADTLVAPTQRIVKAHREILVRAGNMGGVDLSFNGKELPQQGAYGEARTLRFDVNGLMPPTPTGVSPGPPAVDHTVLPVTTTQTSRD